jgi:uncharacterized membrane protein HdeD (DUF308 family)
MIGRLQAGPMVMPNQPSRAPRSWWKLFLSGLVAFAFGIAAVYFPANVMFGRILDVIFGDAKPISGSMTAVAAVFWPGITAFVAVELIGVWAFLIGVLELAFAHDSAKERALQIIAAIALIAIGLGMMRWVFAGAVVVTAVVGVVAAARPRSQPDPERHLRTDSI